LGKAGKVMQIVALQPEHLGALVALYRRVTGSAPHCRFTPSHAAFADALLRPARAGTEIVVAVDADVPRGFAALLDRAPTDESQRDAELTALFVDGAQAGQLLLDAAVARARDLGAERLVAFPSEHFHGPIRAYNAGWSGLSDRLGTVAHLLGRNGFIPFHRELHLEGTRERYATAPAPEPPGIVFDVRSLTDGTTVIAAVVGDREVASCEYSGLDRISDDPPAAQWGFIWGLWVDEDMRRRGIARCLMYHALADLNGRGCTACWLTTEATNWPAQALYFALGFDVVDGSTSFRKDLQGVR
jgi:ribosomal protein S18 acetylase RimI-like enzyme